MSITEILTKFNNVFNNISLDNEKHIYTVNNEEYISVTQYINKFSIPFDKKKAIGVANKRGCSVQQILNEWDTKRKTSADNGTKVHKFGENYFNKTEGFLSLEDNLLPLKVGVLKYFRELPSYIIPIASELKVYSTLYKIAGTIDLVLYDTLNDIIYIDDYKTNEDLYKSYDNLLEPFHNLKSTPFNKYSIQLSLYKIIIEEMTGLKIGKIRLVHLKEFDYSIIECQEFNNILKTIL